MKAHKSALIERERELIARESVLASLEVAQNAAISMKDSEIASLQAQLAEIAASIPGQLEQAVAYREQELRNAVLDYEKVVELRVQRREQEIMEAVRVREAEMCEAWQSHETALRAAFQAELEERWRAEQEALERMREEIEEKTRALEESQRKGVVQTWSAKPFGGLTSAYRTEEGQDAVGGGEEHPRATRAACQGSATHPPPQHGLPNAPKPTPLRDAERSCDTSAISYRVRDEGCHPYDDRRAPPNTSAISQTRRAPQRFSEGWRRCQPRLCEDIRFRQAGRRRRRRRRTGAQRGRGIALEAQGGRHRRTSAGSDPDSAWACFRTDIGAGQRGK